MRENLELLDILNEIEYITDFNGCYFINIENNSLIESTIPFDIKKDILWEICVLKETFQQFANEVKHGTLSELMLEGDKGYIFLYNMPPHLVLLAIASYETNLSYLKLAMIDILARTRERIIKLGDSVLKIPPKDYGVIGEKLPTPKKEGIPVISKPIEVIPEVSETISTPIDTIEPISNIIESPPPLPLEKESIEAKSDIIEPSTPTPIETEIKEPIPINTIVKPIKVDQNEFISMINSIRDSNETEKYQILKNIFDILKKELETRTGKDISDILNHLKEIILENIGTSLALFDLSRTSTELSKIDDKLKSNDIKKYQEKIDNWSNRIIK